MAQDRIKIFVFFLCEESAGGMEVMQVGFVARECFLGPWFTFVFSAHL